MFNEIGPLQRTMIGLSLDIHLGDIIKPVIKDFVMIYEKLEY